MFNQVIETAKIFIDGCKDNSARIELLGHEINAIRDVRESMTSNDGVSHGRRKNDKVLAEQKAHRARCMAEVRQTLKCRS